MGEIGGTPQLRPARPDSHTLDTPADGVGHRDLRGRETTKGVVGRRGPLMGQVLGVPDHRDTAAGGEHV